MTLPLETWPSRVKYARINVLAESLHLGKSSAAIAIAGCWLLLLVGVAVAVAKLQVETSQEFNSQSAAC